MEDIKNVVKKMNELNKKYGFNWHDNNNAIELWWNVDEEETESIIIEYVDELDKYFETMKFTYDWLYDKVFEIWICEFNTSCYLRNCFEAYI